ncbi:uncharacterized protein [Bemisia tabaci]|uniref:uncharacterized protein n=1 Tax=Bemisia tabaci TaxID=7038 RepID=UPI003B281F4E
MARVFLVLLSAALARAHAVPGDATPAPAPLVTIVNSTSSLSSDSLSSSSSASVSSEDGSRHGKFLISSSGPVSNGIQDKQDLELDDPSLAFNGIYSDCVLQLSFPCFQRKLLVFFDRLGRMKAFNVLGNFLSIVRLKRDLSPAIVEEELKARLASNEVEAQTALGALMEHTLDKFVDNHVLRVNLPFGMTAAMVDENSAERRSSSGNSIDINLGRALGEGRGKKKMKKMMGTMMMMIMGKMALMGPMMMMMIKIKAIKALLLSKLALAMSLLQLFKSMGKGKGGGGGGSGGGKEVIIVHDNHGDSGGGGHGGGGGGYGGSGGGWASGGGGGGGWASGGGGSGWASGGGGHGGGGGDSYAGGVHAGGGDANYAGSDAGHGGGGGGWPAGGGGGGGWGRRSGYDGPPQWMLTYRNNYNQYNGHAQNGAQESEH